jgi:acyl-CoA thioester hydrolase
MSEINVRIRYAEVDRMGFVYHSNYLVFLEMGRTEWLRENGQSYDEMEKSGVFLPVVNLEIKYRKPAKYDDIITIITKVKKRNSRSIEFFYEIKRENDLLIEASSKHIFMNKNGKAIVVTN